MVRLFLVDKNTTTRKVICDVNPFQHAIREVGHTADNLEDRGLWNNLDKDGIVKGVRAGEHIAEYPNDRPYPSSLIRGFIGNLSVHVMVARDPQDDACYVVTACVPDSSLWIDDFRTRKEQ
jgi:hypothetical protein